MKRKLRIAWSVGCGIACLLLVALWVRSYWVYDRLRLPSSLGRTFVQLANGTIKSVYFTPTFRVGWAPLSGWQSFPAEALSVDEMEERLYFYSDSNFTQTGFPQWIPVLILATFVGLPWLPYRFSLRTLLIATTVVAVGLGWIVYAIRN